MQKKLDSDVLFHVFGSRERGLKDEHSVFRSYNEAMDFIIRDMFLFYDFKKYKKKFVSYVKNNVFVILVYQILCQKFTCLLSG